MASILDENVDPEDLKKFEKIYHDTLSNRHLPTGQPLTPKIQFEYAWCLVRSKYSADIKRGITILEELFRFHTDGQRDYIYYLAIGNARIKHYTTALDYTKMFLNLEPGNAQVIMLQQAIKKKMEKEGLVGMAVFGGVVLAAGAILGVGMAIASKAKP